jgi:hypothetical protein
MRNQRKGTAMIRVHLLTSHLDDFVDVSGDDFQSTAHGVVNIYERSELVAQFAAGAWRYVERVKPEGPDLDVGLVEAVEQYCAKQG